MSVLLKLTEEELEIILVSLQDNNVAKRQALGLAIEAGAKTIKQETLKQFRELTGAERHHLYRLMLGWDEPTKQQEIDTANRIIVSQDVTMLIEMTWPEMEFNLPEPKYSASLKDDAGVVQFNFYCDDKELLDYAIKVKGLHRV